MSKWGRSRQASQALEPRIGQEVLWEQVWRDIIDKQ